jgi:hypothetical protein
MTPPQLPSTGPDSHLTEVPRKASDLLLDLEGAFTEDKVTVQAIFDRLERSAFAIVILLLALPNVVPNVPGISTIFGLLLVAPGWQMMTGARHPWLPGFIRKRTVERAHVDIGIRAGVKVLHMVEHIAKPRLSFLTGSPYYNVLGFFVLVLALILILPIPLGNLFPGIALVCIGLAVLNRDGLLVLLSLPAFILALVMSALGAGLIVGFFYFLWTQVSGFFSGGS